MVETNVSRDAANRNRNGRFAIWQRRYATHGIATFPVDIRGKRKKPLITNYGKVGLRASEQLTFKFPDAEAWACMAGRRSRLTVADLDDLDPAIVRECERLFGKTPLVWQTGNGRHAAAYRHNGEARRIRPIPGLPIDLLGGGMVIVPGSMGARQRYRIIRGSFADFDRLPIARLPPEIANRNEPPPSDRVPKGIRNNTLFRTLLRHASSCDNIEALRDVAGTINDAAFIERLTDSELEKTVVSAWGYETTGRNWVGSEPRVQIAHSLVASFTAHPNGADAMLLHHVLQLSHWGRNSFAAAPVALWQTQCIPTWGRDRYRRALAALVEIGMLRIVREGGRGAHDSRLFAFAALQNKGPESGHNIKEHPPPPNRARW